MQWILHDIPIGRNIQNIRIRKNMTQLELITKMQLLGSNMSRSTLANIETGRRNVKASDLKALKIILMLIMTNSLRINALANKRNKNDTSSYL